MRVAILIELFEEGHNEKGCQEREATFKRAPQGQRLRSQVLRINWWREPVRPSLESPRLLENRNDDLFGM